MLERIHKLSSRLWPLVCMHCTSASFGPQAPPFSPAEVTHALAPLHQLEQRCYSVSASQRHHSQARFEFIAYVNEHGRVHADPQLAAARDPALLECLRTGIETLAFPDKGARDQFRLSFDLASR